MSYLFSGLLSSMFLFDRQGLHQLPTAQICLHCAILGPGTKQNGMCTAPSWMERGLGHIHGVGGGWVGRMSGRFRQHQANDWKSSQGSGRDGRPGVRSCIQIVVGKRWSTGFPPTGGSPLVQLWALPDRLSQWFLEDSSHSSVTESLSSPHHRRRH